MSNEAETRSDFNVGMFKSLNGLVLENNDGIGANNLIDSAGSLICLRTVHVRPEPDAVSVFIIPALNRHISSISGSCQILGLQVFAQAVCILLRLEGTNLYINTSTASR